MDVTVVIPVGPRHHHLAPRALQSVLAQTEVCDLAVIYDEQGRGAGWARNEGLKQVTTPYTLFLDADDWLEPDAAAVLLAAAKAAPNAYAYPDWYGAAGIVTAHDCCYCLPEYRGHTVTALVPTAWIREIGGFDEDLPYLEDTDFWLKMRYVGKRDGTHVGRALLHYAPDGHRSSGAYYRQGNFVSLTAGGERTRKMIVDRYKEVLVGGCCVQRSDTQTVSMAAHQAGDVLAQALWSGNRSVIGKRTGRSYKGGNGRRMWVNPQDLVAAPNLWRRIS